MQVVGFEPNETEFNKLKQSPNEKWIQAAVAGRPGRRVLHLTKAFNNSSLLPPNKAIIDQLELGDGFDVVSELPLDCVTLDDSMAANAVRADFLKVDTQGTELEILCGAERLLEHELVMVEVEVEFCPLYEKQPLFADVDSRMREKGFYLHELGNMLYVKPRGMRGMGGAKGRIISADALYFKELPALCTMDERKIASALIASAAYGYPELGIMILEAVQRAGRKFLNPAEMEAVLEHFRRSSDLWKYLPGRQFFARCAKRLWLNMRPTMQSLWENQLGNRPKS